MRQHPVDSAQIHFLDTGTVIVPPTSAVNGTTNLTLAFVAGIMLKVTVELRFMLGLTSTSNPYVSVSEVGLGDSLVDMMMEGVQMNCVETERQSRKRGFLTQARG